MTTCRTCEVCHNQFHHDEKYDADYCDPCDEWKDKKCSDADCYFCPTRPDRPSQVTRQTPGGVCRGFRVT